MLTDKCGWGAGVENLYLASTTRKMGQNEKRWMLNVGGNFGEDICMALKCLRTGCSLVARGKVGIIRWRTGHLFGQANNMTFAIDGRKNIACLHCDALRGSLRLGSTGAEKAQGASNRGSESPPSPPKKEHWKSQRHKKCRNRVGCSRLKEAKNHDNYMHDIILDYILHWKAGHALKDVMR